MSQTIQRLFDTKNIPQDALWTLENFDKVIQDIIPANSKQESALPKQIRDLSHQMTDERERRRKGYMNEKTALVAYARYFMWWNLVRLTRLFSNLDFSFLRDGDICLDIGSGPLTVICALWLSQPELRKKNLVWHAMDISRQALNLGEEIFLSIAAKSANGKTRGESANEEIIPWKIVRVKDSLGSAIRQKAAFVSCANVFNEILQNESAPPDSLAKKYSNALFPYLQENASVLLIEPGVPASARFVSLMRDAFLRNGFFASAPCPHQGRCPMDGRRAGKSGASGKWCNFAFETADAPKRLLSLSEKSRLPKERAVLSFVLMQRGADAPKATENQESIRIVSDTIHLAQKGMRGHYACARKGFSLALCTRDFKVKSGDLICDAKEKSERDEKTNALIFEI
ncbi:MAG: hypothetical protein J1E59_00830 [Treponema sp.]|nr:hypothetical protein [Treponema sp.]